jgi:hypothetical protein
MGHSNEVSRFLNLGPDFIIRIHLLLWKVGRIGQKLLWMWR